MIGKTTYASISSLSRNLLWLRGQRKEPAKH